MIFRTRNLVLLTFAVGLALALSAYSNTAFAGVLSQYTAGMQIKNLDTANDATVAISFYKLDGSVEATVNKSITAGSSITLFPLSDVSAGFSGSAVISSDRQIAAIANVIGDSTQSSSYSGFAAGSNVSSLPLTMKKAFGSDTWFSVQNAGSAATTVTVEYAGTACTETATIQPGAAARFDQNTNTCLPDGHINSATVTAANTSDRIVTTVIQVAAAGLFAYNGFGSGATSPVMPLVQFNNFGNQTGIQVQNTDANNASIVTLSYTPSLFGTACTETKTIAAGASATFGLYPFTGFTDPAPGTSDCTQGQSFVGSAAVTSNSASTSLVAIVNQTNLTTNGSAYSAFNPAQATNTVDLPLMMNAFGFFTGLSLVNVGTEATVTCNFSTANGITPTSYSETVAANGSMAKVQNTADFAGYVGGGTCTASGGGLLIAVVNQLGSGSGDQAMTHEAFNK